jgi:hypothetical protein
MAGVSLLRYVKRNNKTNQQKILSKVFMKDGESRIRERFMEGSLTRVDLFMKDSLRTMCHMAWEKLFRVMSYKEFIPKVFNFMGTFRME